MAHERVRGTKVIGGEGVPFGGGEIGHRAGDPGGDGQGFTRQAFLDHCLSFSETSLFRFPESSRYIC